MKNTKIMIIVLLVAVGALGFLGGMKYQQTKAPANIQQPGRGGSGRLGQNGGGRPIAGDIIVQDEKSITIKLADGSSKIVLFSDKTMLNKASSATKDDLKTGVRVAAFGSQNSDGSVTAQNIQINPSFGSGASRSAGVAN